MFPTIPDLPPELAEVLQAGMVLGQNQTFALVSGRCSAAQAEALLRLRESKCYLRLARNWKEFCPKFLNMSYSQADRIIRCWQEFGAGFFELQKLVGISPDTYRSIEPAIKDGALHFNEEAIELDPENSQKVVAAVAELRRSLPAKEPPPAKEPQQPPTVSDRLADLDKRSAALFAELKQIGGMNCEGEDKDRLGSVLQRASAVIDRMKMELGSFDGRLSQNCKLERPKQRLVSTLVGYRSWAVQDVEELAPETQSHVRADCRSVQLR